MTNRQKNILAVIGFILMLFLCYKLAFNKSLEQKKQFKTLSKEVALLKNAPKQLLMLKKKELYCDSILAKYKLNKGASYQNNLLKVINSFTKKHNLTVISFNEPHVLHKKKLVIKTYKFIIKGHFNGINKLIYKLEQKTKFGEIINVHFEKKKNFKSGSNYLQATILLKKIS